MNQQGNTKVYIDASCKMTYSSFYIKGLYEVFGKSNVHFATKYFDGLDQKNEPRSFEGYMACVLVPANGDIKRIIIDFNDNHTVIEKAYNWADKYAKINFNLDLTEKKFHGKMISIPPSFCVKLWGLGGTIYHSWLNFSKCKFKPLAPFKSFFIEYYRTYKRAVLEDYSNLKANSDGRNDDKPYVFMKSTLWPTQSCIEGTNLERKTFFELCKKLGCDTEGGFRAVKTSHPQYKEFEHLISLENYSSESIIEKTKSSAVVFNTPSVHDSHGWKLGEFLAMGKAIISMPIPNELPEKLIHGKDIHIASNLTELELAISALLNDTSYRKSLENGAANYYAKHCSPRVVIENILNN